MSTRDIRTSQVDVSCDVCGRTLLRGERVEVYLDGTERRSVCELCKSRALHEGWIREGTLPAYGSADGGSDRRRSLLGRLRRRADGRSAPAARPTLDDELDGQAWQDVAGEPPPVQFERPSRRRPGEPEPRRRAPTREPRHVHAVPTSAEQRKAEAVESFNDSEHTRTVAGVARSLGIPEVTVLAADERPSVVTITVSWELCWYRYEIDLSDDEAGVRVAAQGYELVELDPAERHQNAVSDEHGRLSLAG